MPTDGDFFALMTTWSSLIQSRIVLYDTFIVLYVSPFPFFSLKSANFSAPLSVFSPRSTMPSQSCVLPAP